MKGLIFVLLILGCSPAWSEEGFHIFTDTQGRAINARIVSYDVRKETILMQMENGRQGKIPLDTLSAADKEYVRMWQVGRDFLNERVLKVSAKRKSEANEQKSDKVGVVTRKVENYGYELLLENKSEMEFPKVEMQYCIYYEQEEGVTGKNECKQGVYCGTESLGNLPAGSKRELKTRPVLIYKAELDSGWYYTSGTDSSQDGEVHGIWVRFTMELPGGDKVVRDFSLPDSIPNGHQWTTTSVKVGMN